MPQRSPRALVLAFASALLGLLSSGCPVYGDRPQISTTDGADCADQKKGGSSVGDLSANACTCKDQKVPLVGEPLPGMDETSVPRRGGTLRVHLEANLPSMMYLMHSDAWIHHISIHNLYQTLVRQDPRTYETRGELAESWEHDQTGLTWTFKLRKGVTWHDGAPFTSKDVKFTFDTFMNSQNRTEHLRAPYQDVLDPVHPYEAPDDSTFVIHLKKPIFTFLQDLDSTIIVPEHIFGRGEFNTHPNVRAPVGTGPFRFIEWTGEQFVMERNSTYWGRQPYLDRVEFKLVTDRETAFLMLKRGDLDFMTRIQPHQRTEGYTEEVAAGFNLTDHVPSQYAFWVYNTRLPVFADARTRRAMTHLMPIDRVICEIYQCQGSPVTGPFPQTHPAYDRDLKPWPYDPEAAMALLEEAGWTDTDGDGIRDKEIDGVRQPFQFTFLLTANSRTLEQQLTVVQASARRAGVDIKLSKVDWSVFVERLRKGEFEAASLLWILSHETDPYGLFHSTQPQNYGKWKNEEADHILDVAHTILDETARNVLYRRLHHILHEEQPYSFIYTPVLPGLISKKFAGVYTSDQHYQWYDIWKNDPALPEVPPEERHPHHTGAPPWDATGR